MSSNVPWFKLAVIGTFIGVSALIGYAASSTYFKASEAESVEPVVSEGKTKLLHFILKFCLSCRKRNKSR